MRSTIAVSAIVAVMSGCGLAGGPVAPAPTPLADPRIVVVPSDEVLEPVHVAYLIPPDGEVRVDGLLASPVMRDPEFQAAVSRWVEYWQTSASSWFPDFIHRMGAFEQTVDSALYERGLPPSLRYLPLIESGYNPGARSHASAVGMWQFMAGTAREHGMSVEAFVDERRNPFKSTDAAADYLDRLHRRFESWFLTLAAYNGGPNRAQRILRAEAPLAVPSDSLFWALRDHWPRETREFVPKLVGAIIVAQNPTAYGYEALQRAEPLRFDVVTVPEATTFDVLARAAETDEEEIRRLNPELFRGFTPPGRSHALRVPAGRAARFESNYAAIPAGERMTIVEHAVAPGETLTHIARRYGVSVGDLQAANPDIRPRYLQVGARVTVPILLTR